MKIGLSALVLVVKGVGLTCIAFMGTVAAQGLPCHEVLLDQTDCTACELSLENWSEPLVSLEADDWLQLEPPADSGLHQSYLASLIQTVSPQVQIARAPPDIAFSEGLLAWQNTIRLRL